jgi:hypothetical protein
MQEIVNQHLGSVVLRSDFVEDDRQSQKMKQMIMRQRTFQRAPGAATDKQQPFYSVPDLRMFTFA